MHGGGFAPAGCGQDSPAAGIGGPTDPPENNRMKI
jgi:hypothetical protein